MSTASTWYTTLGRPAPIWYNLPSGYLSSSITQSLAENAGTGAKAIDPNNSNNLQKQIRAASTTIAAGSNGASLPQSTVNVASTVGFDTSQSGTILVTTGSGAQTVTYTGTTATSFTGCSGGTGTMSTGGAVTTTNGGFSATTNNTTQNFMLLQLLSPPLGTQSITGSTSWTLQFAAAVSNAAAGFTWGGIASLFLVDGTNGTIKSTFITSNTAVGTAARTTTTELTCRLSSISSPGTISVTANDYFALELGVAITTGASNSAIPNITIFSDGTTSIGSDAAAASSALSTFTTPAAVTYFPAARRTNIDNPFILQPRGPDGQRAQLSVAPAQQPRAPSAGARAQLPANPVMQPRTADLNVYRMRGFDNHLSVIVFWNASLVDTAASQYRPTYAGTIGPVTDIVVVTILET